MKDFDIKSKEWWKVAKVYFAKKLEKNLAQHRVNEKNLMYKLEIYQKKNRVYLWHFNKYRDIKPR